MRDAGRDLEAMMRSTGLLLLASGLLVGCFRPQAVESDITKANLTGGRVSGTSTGDSPPLQSLTSQADVTPQQLADALKQKGVDVDLSPIPGRDRHGAIASMLTLRSVGAGESRVLAYLCADEDITRELVGLMGETAFASGRFAIGPYLRTPDDQALARNIRKALE